MPKNRLAHEKSPYLLQHAGNPVDWYPWGEEALERSRVEDKPIFLSIGYSTCHWCHVMERESFEDASLAALLNESFVCIKVDREERPDLDEIYMAAVQAMGQPGGWPLNLFLTPELVPFFGGTYFPPEDRFGRPGFRRLLQSVDEAWDRQREGLREQAATVQDWLQRLQATPPSEGELDRTPVDAALAELRRLYDARDGGFGSAPKFPRADYGRILLRAFARSGEGQDLDMALRTLDAMAAGGIHDHLGGGFARYSTDSRWRVPHFEKMLYDNAQLALHYLEAYQLTRARDHADVARGIFEYVMRDLCSEGGGFYSAEDADSEGIEGLFYVWDFEELRSVLDDEEFALFAERFAIRPEGNWEGRNVLELGSTVEEIAERRGLEIASVRERLESARTRLLEVRSRRVRPGLDDKVLTGWNGLMIGALARGGMVLEERRYVDAAARAADFVLSELRNEAGLLRRWRDGEAGIPAYAEDYAMLISGLLELYAATFDFDYLRHARDLHAELFRDFADTDGALFHTRAGQDDLLVRVRMGYDGSTPTANSVAAANALQLFELTGEVSYAEQCERILRAFLPILRRSPLTLSHLLNTLDAWFAPRRELVLAGGERSEALRWGRAARRGYVPDLALSWIPGTGAGDPSTRPLPAWEGKDATTGLRAYVCRGFSCRKPTSDPRRMAEELAFVRCD